MNLTAIRNFLKGSKTKKPRTMRLVDNRTDFDMAKWEIERREKK